MSQNTIKDLIDLGWTDEEIRLIAGYELGWIQRMRKQVEENEEKA